MKFCTHCGKELLDEAVICPGCGCAVERSTGTQTTGSQSFGTQPAAERPKASYDFAARSLVTNIVSGVLMAVGVYLALIVQNWLGLIFLLASELIAAIPDTRIKSVFRENGLKMTMHDKEQKQAIMKQLRKKYPGLIVAMVLMCVNLVCLIVFTFFYPGVYSMYLF